MSEECSDRAGTAHGYTRTVGILSDIDIEGIQMKYPDFIAPYHPDRIRKLGDGTGCLSYGCSSMGYDVTLGNEFLFAREGVVLDPKRPDRLKFRSWTTDLDESILLRPGDFVLAQTVERLSMPDDVLALAIGKSTYARVGLHVNCTPIEPGWSGIITLELSNPGKHIIRIYPGEGICQLIFFRSQEEPSENYKKLGGKYQAADGLQLAKV